MGAALTLGVSPELLGAAPLTLGVAPELLGVAPLILQSCAPTDASDLSSNHSAGGARVARETVQAVAVLDAEGGLEGVGLEGVQIARLEGVQIAGSVGSESAR